MKYRSQQICFFFSFQLIMYKMVVILPQAVSCDDTYQSGSNLPAVFMAKIINTLQSCWKDLPEFIYKFTALAPAILQDVIC